MKKITKRLGVVSATRLPGWGPRDPHCAWLEIWLPTDVSGVLVVSFYPDCLSEYLEIWPSRAFNGACASKLLPSMRSSFSNPPSLDSPLTVLDLCISLSAPACNAQLPTPSPKSSMNETAAATTTVQRVRVLNALPALFCLHSRWSRDTTHNPHHSGLNKLWIATYHSCNPILIVQLLVLICRHLFEGCSLAYCPPHLYRARITLVPKVTNPISAYKLRQICVSSNLVRGFRKILLIDGAVNCNHPYSSLRFCIEMVVRKLRRRYEPCFVALQQLLLVRCIAHICENAVAVILNSDVHCHRGVRERDPLSPILFIEVVSEVLRLSMPQLRCQFHDILVDGFAFADDCCCGQVDNSWYEDKRPNDESACDLWGQETPGDSGLGLNFLLLRGTYRSSGSNRHIRAFTCFRGEGNLPSSTAALLLLDEFTSAPLKSHQRMKIARNYLEPRQTYLLVLVQVHRNTLRRPDNYIRQFINDWLRLPKDALISFYHVGKQHGEFVSQGVPDFSIPIQVQVVSVRTKKQLVTAWGGSLHKSNECFLGCLSSSDATFLARRSEALIKVMVVRRSYVVETMANRRVWCIFRNPAGSRMTPDVLVIIGLQGNLQNVSLDWAPTSTWFIKPDLIAVRDRRAAAIDVSIVSDGRAETVWNEKKLKYGADEHSLIRQDCYWGFLRPQSMTCVCLPLRTLGTYDTFMRGTWR
ncbi:hypothetical protein T265_00591 [Opisthorchis viverrini]|uniref:Reverse transcriptase domain-containing protein n=1 Tax=Opisthorchis viverrini TaxID=6198 RepID=A0A075AJJ1_OPIVI|nr:hypothetical protein T265_00591 [Opisthorchis viverrini]KER33474.1 hypothetical protein T265_00591 [Opisthorchis viverrini]